MVKTNRELACQTAPYIHFEPYFFFRAPLPRLERTPLLMKKLFLLGTATIAGVLIAISPVLAQDGQTFRGVVKSAKGWVLTVTGGGETHEFAISGLTKITGPYAKCPQASTSG